MSQDVIGPRFASTYTFDEVAQYLRIDPCVLQGWLMGTERYWQVVDGAAVVSFMDMIESHVVHSINEFPDMFYAAKKLKHVARELGDEWPLCRGVNKPAIDMFVEALCEQVDFDKEALKRSLTLHCLRIEADGDRVRFYPFTRDDIEDAPSYICIDPSVNFGRPIIKDFGIPTAQLVDRFCAGETIDELIADSSLARKVIEEAIRFEFPRRFG